MMFAVSSTLTIVTSLLGGGLLGTVGGWLTTWQVAEMNRRGRARLLHEDLYRLQSTVTRLFFQTAAEGDWGEKPWLLVPLCDKADQQDVISHLKAGEGFSDCAGALGWAEYLREDYGSGRAPDDQALQKMYRRLDRGRRSLETLAKLPYATHDPEHVVPLQARERNKHVELAAEPRS
jgi:hypothetical protein